MVRDWVRVGVRVRVRVRVGVRVRVSSMGMAASRWSHLHALSPVQIGPQRCEPA